MIIFFFQFSFTRSPENRQVIRNSVRRSSEKIPGHYYQKRGTTKFVQRPPGVVEPTHPPSDDPSRPNPFTLYMDIDHDPDTEIHLTETTEHSNSNC